MRSLDARLFDDRVLEGYKLVTEGSGIGSSNGRFHPVVLRCCSRQHQQPDCFAYFDFSPCDRVRNRRRTSWRLLGDEPVSSIDKLSEKIDTLRDRAVETSGSIKLIQKTESAQARVLVGHEAGL
jgi:hypothetical protein